MHDDAKESRTRIEQSPKSRAQRYASAMTTKAPKPPRTPLDDVLEEIANEVHRAFDEHGQPSKDAKVLALIDKANALRKGAK